MKIENKVLILFLDIYRHIVREWADEPDPQILIHPQTGSIVLGVQKSQCQEA